jgi:hypothetical protein
MLLTSAWRRLLAAGGALALLWAAVIWVAPSAPSIAPDRPAERVPIQPTSTPVAAPAGLRTVAWSGLTAPGGGRFDRFDSASHPIVAPVNARGQVAFYATVLHAFGREGLYIADSEHVTKVAAFGDSIPGGGSLAEFGAHPLPALNNAGHVAFTAGVAGGRATEGIFLTSTEGLRVIALAGDDAPSIPAGILVGFNAPALNDNDELAFVANVRRGHDILDVLYFWNGTRLQRVIAEGDRLLRIGGAMDKIGEPALNNSGVIAFPAAIFKGPALGGIFVAGARDLRLLVSAGDRVPSGAMIVRFSERVAIDDDDAIAFSSYLGNDGNTREAILVNKADDGLVEVAVEGAAAPGGGRYAAFGPWPTIAAGGVISFIAALDGAPEPLAVFVGIPNEISPVVLVDKTSAKSGLVGHLTLNTVPSVGPDGAVTFATVAQESAGGNAIYCRCLPPSR